MPPTARELDYRPGPLEFYPFAYLDCRIDSWLEAVARSVNNNGGWRQLSPGLLTANTEEYEITFDPQRQSMTLRKLRPHKFTSVERPPQ